MNNNFYQYALEVLNSLTTDEIEAGLRDFGIECKRNVSLFDNEDVDVLGKFGISWPATDARRIQEREEFASSDYAANDNSYALAA